MTIIDRSSLEVGDLLGAGTQGAVYKCFCSGVAESPLVYKEYKRGSQPPLGGLAGLATWRASLEKVHLEWLDRHSTWPIAAVQDRSDVRAAGVLMRSIDTEYYVTGTTRLGVQFTELREVSWLVSEDKYSVNAGVDIASPLRRLRVLGSAASTLVFLHRRQRGIVFGDLNPRNVVFRVDGDQERALYLDCDAVRFVSSGEVAEQLQFFSWQAPEGGATKATDVYKFSLLVMRALADTSATTPRLVDTIRHQIQGRLEPMDLASRSVDMLLSLIESGLSSSPYERPSMLDWHEYFVGNGWSSNPPGVGTWEEWASEKAEPSAVEPSGEWEPWSP